MDTMSISTRSRSPSLFSLTSTLSTCPSTPSSPFSPGAIEKPAAASTPLVLEWRPQLFSTAFTSTRSTWLHFSAFPPHNVPKHTFQHLSRDTAISLIHRDGQAGILSLFATPSSTVEPTCNIPIPSSLPVELVQCLRSDVWDYYTIKDSTVLPIGISSLSSTYQHHVAFRKIRDGVERYIFGPGGLSIHSVCRITDAGATAEESIPRETLYIEEKIEVICSKVLKWWVESQISRKTAEAHENFRSQWEERFMTQWEMTRRSEKIDLLA